MWPFQRRARAPDPAPPPAAPQLPARRISGQAIARVARAPDTLSERYRIPEPPPGTVPPGRATMAQDSGFVGNINQWSQGGQWQTGGYAVEEGLTFLGYPYLSELSQRSEYRRPAEILAKEMTRKWIKLHASGTKEDKTRQIYDLEKEMDRLDVQGVMREWTEHDGLFGMGQMYVDLGRDDPEELTTPLIARSKIQRGSLKRLKCIEPIWVYPANYNASNPIHRDFYEPSTWWVQGTEIHASRFFKLTSREVPDLLKPAYLFGGLSLTQMIKPTVDNWLDARASVSDLMRSFSTMVFATDMASTLSGDAGTVLADRIAMFNLYRDNRGTFVVDKDTEQLTNVSASLSGLDKLQAQAQEHISAVCGIPLVKLLGISPSGLNASSDGEIRCFYDWIAAQQVAVYRKPLTRLLRMLMLNIWGHIDESINFTFEPLWDPTEVERATLRKTNADTAAVYIADGVIDAEEERRRLATEAGGMYDGLDLSKTIQMPGQEQGDGGGEEGGGLDPNIGGGMGREFAHRDDAPQGEAIPDDQQPPTPDAEPPPGQGEQSDAEFDAEPEYTAAELAAMSGGTPQNSADDNDADVQPALQS